jgi:hypothetical protein
VLLSHVVRLQHRIRAAIASAKVPTEAVSLRDLAMQTSRPFLLVMIAVVRLLNGGFESASWGEPYDWASITLDRPEADALASELEASQASI